MKMIQFSGSVTITRELSIDAPIQFVASILNRKVKEIEAMSQGDLEELLMDNIYTIEANALQLRSSNIDYHDDYFDEQLHELTITE